MLPGASISSNGRPTTPTRIPARRPSARACTLSVSSCRITRRAAGADGGANRHFPLPHRGARQQQVRHIRARDQQHERRPRRAARAAPVLTSPTVASRIGTTRDAFVLVHPLRIGRAEAFADDLHRGPRLSQRDARLQTARDPQVMSLVGAVRIGLQRKADVGGRVGQEALRAARRSRCADLPSIGVVRPRMPGSPPKRDCQSAVAEDRDRRPARLVVLDG